MPDFDPQSVVRVLNRHGVRYVVIGGIAARVHNLPVPATVDIDVTPARDTKNLQRLAAAFEELDAGLATAEEGGGWFPRIPVENWAQYDVLHLTTRYGLLDIVFRPAGAEQGYKDLAKSAVRLEVGDQKALVITVERWKELKLATGRDKDLEHLVQIASESPPEPR